MNRDYERDPDDSVLTWRELLAMLVLAGALTCWEWAYNLRAWWRSWRG